MFGIFQSHDKPAGRLTGFPAILIFFACLGNLTAGHDPGWGSYIALDLSQLIVVGRMHIENLKDGFGWIEVSKVLKGKIDGDGIKVQFSDSHQEDSMTKHAEPPRYWYGEGQEGIWLLKSRNNLHRYDLRQANLFFDIKWESWIVRNAAALRKRVWTKAVKGLSGSVIVDDAGANTSYRFFYLCLRNDSKSSLFINTHYRIREEPQQRFEAFIVTPGAKKIDMINGNDPDCRLAGEPGWPEPDIRDFVELKPGGRMFLLSSGDLRCFFRNPEHGIYAFQATYRNKDVKEEIRGRIWTGEIIFPVTSFGY